MTKLNQKTVAGGLSLKPVLLLGFSALAACHWFQKDDADGAANQQNDSVTEVTDTSGDTGPVVYDRIAWYMNSDAWYADHMGEIPYEGVVDVTIDGSTGGYETALADGHASGQLILLDFWATWCGPCLYMEANIYTDQAVIDEVMSKYHPVKIDVDVENDIQAHYGISSIPTVLVFRVPDDGQDPVYPEDYIVGFNGAPETPEDFIELLQTMEQMVTDDENGG